MISRGLALRAATALLFAPALLALLWLGGLYADITCAVLTALAAWEFFRLTLPDVRRMQIAGIVLTALLAMALLGYLPFGPPAVTVGALLIFLLVLAHPLPMEKAMQRAGLLAFGAIYCGALLPSLAILRRAPDGIALSLAALFCTWGADTGAYFAGRGFGRTKLAPTISPGKTVEGAGGAVAAAIAVAFLVRWLFANHWTPAFAVTVGVITSLFGMVGDLCESLLKRSVGAKDSSGLIPGHGGLLDRFDGVMFAAPALLMFLRIVKRL